MDFQVRERLLDVIGIDFILAVADDGDTFATLTLGHDFGDIIEIAQREGHNDDLIVVLADLTQASIQVVPYWIIWLRLS